WEHSNDNHMGGGNVPGKAITDFHDANLTSGARSIITLPAAGYVSKDKKGAVSQAETAPSPRWAKVVHEKGAPFPAAPDTTDNNVYTDEFVDMLVKKYGAATGERGIKHYSVDNEPPVVAYASPHPSRYHRSRGAGGKNRRRGQGRQKDRSDGRSIRRRVLRIRRIPIPSERPGL